MPWEPRICYYCDKKYANRQGLRTHLGRYVGEWRLPADGVHDALEIDQILNPERHEPEYKCPDCSLIITPRSKFVGHLVYRHNYENHVHGRSPDWPFSFGEDEVKVFQPEGPFAFLSLPFAVLRPDLRHMVYMYLLRFPRIRFGSKVEVSISEPHRNGNWLQRNPHGNPLTPLMVSRQFYHETRRVFYGLNTFAFGGVEALLVFLIGIGRRNAMLLRSVSWGPDCLYENRADILRSCLAQQGSTDTERPNIWNDKTHYAHFLETFNTNPHSDICPRGNNEYCRLLRLGMSGLSTRDLRNRYKLVYVLQEHDKHGEREGKGRVSFDLYSRTEEVLL